MSNVDAVETVALENSNIYLCTLATNGNNRAVETHLKKHRLVGF